MSAPNVPRCRRCRRVLKSPAAIAARIGPVCAAKEQAETGRGGKPRVRKGEVVFDPNQLSLFLVEVKL